MKASLRISPGSRPTFSQLESLEIRKLTKLTFQPKYYESHLYCERVVTLEAGHVFENSTWFSSSFHFSMIAVIFVC